MLRGETHPLFEDKIGAVDITITYGSTGDSYELGTVYIRKGVIMGYYVDGIGPNGDSVKIRTMECFIPKEG